MIKVFKYRWLLAVCMACMLMAPASAAANDLKQQTQEMAFIEAQYNKAMQAGQVRRALEWAKQGYDMATQVNVPFIGDFGRMLFAGYVGNAARKTGDYTLARNAYTVQRELALKYKNNAQLWYALNGLGGVSWGQKRLEEAQDWFAQAMEVARRMKNDVAENSSRYNRSIVYEEMGLTDKALAGYKASLAFHRKRKDKEGEADVLNAIGGLYLNTKPSLALKYFKQALGLRRALGNKRAIAMALGNVGAALGNMGRVAEALDYQMQALRMDQEVGDKHAEWIDSKNASISLRKLGRFKEAAEYQAHADYLKRQLGQ